MNKLRKLTILLLALLVAFGVFSGTAFAAFPTPPGGYSITVEAKHEGVAVPGMTYKLYKVASIDEAGNVTPTTVAGVQLPAKISDSSEWSTALESLGGHTDQLTQVGDAKTTGDDGKLTFNSGLEPAIYLVVGDSVTIGGVPCTAQTAWTQLPVPRSGGGWNFDPVVKPKIGPATTTSIQVVKHWNDAAVILDDGKAWDLSKYRPAKVTVELLKSGVVDRTVELSDSNNWTHTWQGLAAGNWEVREVVPEGYTMTSSTQPNGTTNVTTITNTPSKNDFVVVDPPIQKLVQGAGAPTTSRFKFQMEAISNTAGIPVQDMPMPAENVNGKIVVTVIGPGAHEFGDFILHTPGVYLYKLSEVDGGEAGYAYDQNYYYKEFTVKYDSNGKLIAEERLLDNRQQAIANTDATFVNNYKPVGPVSPVSVTLDASKVLKGSPKTTADFEFRLVGKNKAPMPSGSQSSQKTVKVHGQGSASFGAITFTAPGTYVYEVSEVNARLSGYTYDTNVYTVTIKVDNVDGVLSAAISAQNSSKQSVKWDELVFTNTYKDPAPQTGILWWPVPVLLASGLLLVLMGIIRRRKYEN